MTKQGKTVRQFEEDVEQSKGQVVSLQADIEQSKGQVVSLQADVEQSRGQVASLQGELAALSDAKTKEAKQSKDQFTKMRSKARSLNEELKALQVKHKEQMGQRATERETAMSELALLAADKDDASAKGAAELKHAKEQFAKMRAKAKLLQESLKDTKRRSSSTENEKAKEMEGYQGKIASLESVVKSQKQKIKVHLSKIQAGEAALTAAHDTATASAKSKTASLQQALDSLALAEDEKSKVSEALAALESKYSDLSKGFDKQRKVSSVADSQLADVKEEKAAAEGREKASKAKINETKLKAKVIQEERNELRARVGKAEEDAKALRKAKTATEEELRSTNDQLARLEVDFDMLQLSCTESDAREGMATARLEMLEKEMADMQKAASTSGIFSGSIQSNSNGEVAQLELQLEMKVAEIERLQVSLISAEEATEMSDTTVMTLEEELESLRRDHDESLGREASRVSSVDPEQDTTRVELLWAQTKLQEVTKTLTETREAFAKLEGANTAFTEDASTRHTQVAALVQERDAAVADKNSIEQEVAALNLRLDSQQTQISDQDKQIMDTSRINADIRNDLQGLRRINTEVQARNAILEAECTQLQSLPADLARATSAVTETSASLDDAGLLDNADASGDSLAADIMQAQYSELQGKYDTLLALHEALALDVPNVTEPDADSQARYADLEAEHESLKERYETVLAGVSDPHVGSLSVDAVKDAQPASDMQARYSELHLEYDRLAAEHQSLKASSQSVSGLLDSQIASDADQAQYAELERKYNEVLQALHEKSETASQGAPNKADVASDQTVELAAKYADLQIEHQALAESVNRLQQALSFHQESAGSAATPETPDGVSKLDESRTEYQTPFATPRGEFGNDVQEAPSSVAVDSRRNPAPAVPTAGTQNMLHRQEELKSNDYLRDVVYKYMSGDHPERLAGVIATLMEFSPEQQAALKEKQTTETVSTFGFAVRGL